MSNTQNVTTNPETSTPETSTPETWETRIEAASVYMGIKAEKVLQALAELGVEKEPAGMEMLSDENITPFGDLRKVFCDGGSLGLEIPIAKVRMAMKYLRGPKGSVKTDTISPEMIKMKEKYGIKPKLENIPTDQLLEDYVPNRSDHPITIILKRRFGDKAVIAFKPDSTEVDIEATANYIADLDMGYDIEEIVESQGELVRLYKVGEVPSQVIEEDPMFRGRPLKRGRSMVNRVNWTEVNIEERQFVCLLVEAGVIAPDDRRDIKDIVGIIDSEGIDGLKKEFPEIALIWRERKELNNLPNLTMTMEQAEKSKSNNPFGINRQY